MNHSSIAVLPVYYCFPVLFREIELHLPSGIWRPYGDARFGEGHALISDAMSAEALLVAVDRYISSFSGISEIGEDLDPLYYPEDRYWRCLFERVDGAGLSSFSHRGELWVPEGHRKYPYDADYYHRPLEDKASSGSRVLPAGREDVVERFFIRRQVYRGAYPRERVLGLLMLSEELRDGVYQQYREAYSPEGRANRLLRGNKFLAGEAGLEAEQNLPEYDGALSGWYDFIDDDLRDRVDAEVASAADFGIRFDDGWVYVYASDGDQMWLYGEYGLSSGSCYPVDLGRYGLEMDRPMGGEGQEWIDVPREVGGRTVEVYVAYSVIQWSLPRLQYFGGYCSGDARVARARAYLSGESLAFADRVLSSGIRASSGDILDRFGGPIDFSGDSRLLSGGDFRGILLWDATHVVVSGNRDMAIFWSHFKDLVEGRIVSGESLLPSGDISENYFRIALMLNRLFYRYRGNLVSRRVGRVKEYEVGRVFSLDEYLAREELEIGYSDEHIAALSLQGALDRIKIDWVLRRRDRVLLKGLIGDLQVSVTDYLMGGHGVSGVIRDYNSRRMGGGLMLLGSLLGMVCQDPSEADRLFDSDERYMDEYYYDEERLMMRPLPGGMEVPWRERFCDRVYPVKRVVYRELPGGNLLRDERDYVDGEFRFKGYGFIVGEEAPGLRYFRYVHSEESGLRDVFVGDVDDDIWGGFIGGSGVFWYGGLKRIWSGDVGDYGVFGVRELGQVIRGVRGVLTMVIELGSRLWSRDMLSGRGAGEFSSYIGLFSSLMGYGGGLRYGSAGDGELYLGVSGSDRRDGVVVSGGILDGLRGSDVFLKRVLVALGVVDCIGGLIQVGRGEADLKRFAQVLVGIENVLKAGSGMMTLVRHLVGGGRIGIEKMERVIRAYGLIGAHINLGLSVSNAVQSYRNQDTKGMIKSAAEIASGVTKAGAKLFKDLGKDSFVAMQAGEEAAVFDRVFSSALRILPQINPYVLIVLAVYTMIDVMVSFLSRAVASKYKSWVTLSPFSKFRGGRIKNSSNLMSRLLVIHAEPRIIDANIVLDGGQINAELSVLILNLHQFKHIKFIIEYRYDGFFSDIDPMSKMLPSFEDRKLYTKSFEYTQEDIQNQIEGQFRLSLPLIHENRVEIKQGIVPIPDIMLDKQIYVQLDVKLKVCFDQDYCYPDRKNKYISLQYPVKRLVDISILGDYK